MQFIEIAHNETPNNKRNKRLTGFESSRGNEVQKGCNFGFSTVHTMVIVSILPEKNHS